MGRIFAIAGDCCYSRCTAFHHDDDDNEDEEEDACMQLLNIASLLSGKGGEREGIPFRERNKGGVV